LLCAGALAQSQSAPRPEALIKWRQSAFQVIAWNTGRIKAALSNGDAQELRLASETLAAVANSDLASLFPASTAQGKGWRDTTARAEIFSDPQKFRALANVFGRESAALARLTASADAKTDDQKSVTEQFAKVAKACKGCHDKYRQTD
jgi:cytochrome c556